MELNPMTLRTMPQMVDFLKSSLQSHKEHIASEVRTAVFQDLQVFFASGLDTLHKSIKEAMENLELSVNLSLKKLESRVCVLEASYETIKSEISRISSLTSDYAKDSSDLKGKLAVNEAMISRNYEDIKSLETYQHKLFGFLQEIKTSPISGIQTYQNNLEELFHTVSLIETKLKAVEEVNRKNVGLEFNVLKKDDPRFDQIKSDVIKNTCDLQALRNRFERIEIQISNIV